MLEKVGVNVSDPKTSMAIMQVATSHFGPIPPAQILAEYEEVRPGTANQIIESWERQSTHRQTLEQITTQRAESRLDRSQHYSFAISILLVLACTIIGVWGSPWAAGVLAFAGFGSIGAVTVIARMLGSVQPPE